MLTKEQEDLFNDNIGLVGMMIRKLHPVKRNWDYEDFNQIGLIALWNAVQKYDPTKGIAFSTYACRSIQNNLFVLNKSFSYSYKVDISTDSLDEKVLTGEMAGWSNNGAYAGLLVSPAASILRNIIAKDTVARIFSLCTEKQRYILKRLFIDGVDGVELGKEFGVTRSAASKWRQKIQDIAYYCTDGETS